MTFRKKTNKLPNLQKRKQEQLKAVTEQNNSLTAQYAKLQEENVGYDKKLQVLADVKIE